MPDSLQKQTRWALILLWVVPVLWTVNYSVARKAPGVIGAHLLALGFGCTGFSGFSPKRAVDASCQHRQNVVAILDFGRVGHADLRSLGLPRRTLNAGHEHRADLRRISRTH